MKTAIRAGSFSRFCCGILIVLSGVLMLQVRMAIAAGSVEMQVERIIKISILEYNSAMKTGESDRWVKYFTDNVKRHAPTVSQEGKQALADYYAWEFSNFEANWSTKRMFIHGTGGAVEFEWTATHKPSGTPVKLDMVAIFQLASSGKFESIDFYFDPATLTLFLAGAPGMK